MNYKEQLDNLKKEIILDMMNLFHRSDMDTVIADKIRLSTPYIFTLEYYHPDENGFEKILITGMDNNGNLISQTMEGGEERTVFFDDLCADDLVNLHELFTRNHIYYEFGK
jgi:hypothetical protein